MEKREEAAEEEVLTGKVRMSTTGNYRKEEKGTERKGCYFFQVIPVGLISAGRERKSSNNQKKNRTHRKIATPGEGTRGRLAAEKSANRDGGKKKTEQKVESTVSQVKSRDPSEGRNTTRKFENHRQDYRRKGGSRQKKPMAQRKKKSDGQRTA